MDESMSRDSQNFFVKKSFFDHLLRHGFTAAHLEVYEDYFGFFLERVPGRLMDLDPQQVYQLALTAVEQLDGDEVVEAYLQLMEHFMAFWAERYEAMRPEPSPEEEDESVQEKGGPSAEPPSSDGKIKEPGEEPPG